MEIPKHWRLRIQRLSFTGEICPHCEVKSLVPRAVCPGCGLETRTLFDNRHRSTNRSVPVKKPINIDQEAGR